MEALTPECAAQSVGPANQLFGLLIQTILAAQCAISPKDMWPKDYGPTAIEQGKSAVNNSAAHCYNFKRNPIRYGHRSYAALKSAYELFLDLTT